MGADLASCQKASLVDLPRNVEVHRIPNGALELRLPCNSVAVPD